MPYSIGRFEPVHFACHPLHRELFLQAPSFYPASSTHTRKHAMAAAATQRVLYWGSGSPPAWRVAIALEEKQLMYDSRLLEFSKRASFQP